MTDPENVPTPDPTPDPTPTPEPPARSFTQADVDKIVQDRLARQKAQFANFDEFKEKAERYDEIAEQSKSEQQKLEERAQQAEEAAAKATERANRILRKAQIISAATELNAVDPEAVHALLNENNFTVPTEDGELSVTVGDDGSVTGAKEVVQAFLAGRQSLVGEPRRPDFDGGARKPTPSGQQITRDDLKRMTPEQINNAMEAGQLDHLIKG